MFLNPSLSRDTCHMSCVTCLMSGVRCHTSGVPCQVLHVTSNSQTVRARELKFWDKVHLLQPVTSYMSYVKCHMSHVTWHLFSLFFSLSLGVKVVMLVDGEAVIKGVDFSQTRVLIDQAAAWFWSGSSLIDQSATWFWSGMCLIDQAAAWFWSGSSLIDQPATWFWSGMCLIDQAAGWYQAAWCQAVLNFEIWFVPAISICRSI